MEETRKEEKTENTKVFTAIIAGSIRDLVDSVQEYKIRREDLITILKDEREGYVLFCYKSAV